SSPPVRRQMRNKAVELPPALSPAARASDPSKGARYTRDSCLRGMVSRENGLRKEFAPLGLSALNKHWQVAFQSVLGQATAWIASWRSAETALGISLSKRRSIASRVRTAFSSRA